MYIELLKILGIYAPLHFKILKPIRKDKKLLTPGVYGFLGLYSDGYIKIGKIENKTLLMIVMAESELENYFKKGYIIPYPNIELG